MKPRAFLAPTAVVLAVLFAAFPAVAQDKPATPAAPPQVYDESADAAADIAAALAKAKQNNTRVLVQYGANWCGWCKLLDGLFKSDRQIARTLLYEYELVRVNVGRFDRHLEIADKYGPGGEKLRSLGIPYLTILDADGKVLLNQPTGELEQDKAHDPQKVLAVLDKWKADPRDARVILRDGLTRAAKENKRVFLHFGAPWCVWCHRLEDFLARPEIAKLMERDFVDLKIDIDRMTAGKDVDSEFRTEKGGIPWFAILDETGEKLATADGPEGNIGFPVKDAEIAHFIKMLAEGRRNLTDAELETIRTALTQNSEEILAEMEKRRTRTPSGD